MNKVIPLYESKEDPTKLEVRIMSLKDTPKNKLISAMLKVLNRTILRFSVFLLKQMDTELKTMTIDKKLMLSSPSFRPTQEFLQNEGNKKKETPQYIS